MFTGIITDVGRVRALAGDGGRRITIATDYDVSSIEIGASIACSGTCLTVTDKGEDKDGRWFAVDASAETLRCTTLGGWTVGTPVNLERPLRIGDELGGHIVTGHVDGVGALTAREAEGSSVKMTFEVPSGLARFVAPKGSIAVNGVSLTVNAVDGTRFTVNIIPHTLRVTSLGDCKPGDGVNMEVDVVARYIARLNEKDVNLA